jgi:hypothetical protein
MRQTLQNPEFLKLLTPFGIRFGGSQLWYPEHRQRLSGCGPTAAANQMWYLSRRGVKPLCPNAESFGDYAALQMEMFSYVTPGPMGVNSSALFVSGALRYARERGVELIPWALDVERLWNRRPDASDLRGFVLAGLQSDCPVAFLNLSNGNQNRLDAWHWVTILALDPNSMTARCGDQGHILEINLAQWLRTTLLGGALVYFEAG